MNLGDGKHQSERILGVTDFKDINVAEVIAVHLIRDRSVTFDGHRRHVDMTHDVGACAQMFAGAECRGDNA
ncbi:hypothetical protein MCETE7_00996 [Acidimicrobiia bacterium]